MIFYQRWGHHDKDNQRNYRPYARKRVKSRNNFIRTDGSIRGCQSFRSHAYRRPDPDDDGYKCHLSGIDRRHELLRNQGRDRDCDIRDHWRDGRHLQT